jgi:hypothetical protein
MAASDIPKMVRAFIVLETINGEVLLMQTATIQRRESGTARLEEAVAAYRDAPSRELHDHTQAGRSGSGTPGRPETALASCRSY